MFVTNAHQPSSLYPQHFWTAWSYILHGLHTTNLIKDDITKMFPPPKTLEHLTWTSFLKRIFCPRSNEFFTPLLIQFSKSKSSFPQSSHLFYLFQIRSNKPSLSDPKAYSPRHFYMHHVAYLWCVMSFCWVNVNDQLLLHSL